MEIKKTIAALALSASGAMALTPPPAEVKTICLDVYEDAARALYAGTCDESKNNQTLGKQILKNGCADKQIALHSVKHQGSEKFTIEIYSCLPPNVVQL